MDPGFPAAFITTSGGDRHGETSPTLPGSRSSIRGQGSEPDDQTDALMVRDVARAVATRWLPPIRHGRCRNQGLRASCSDREPDPRTFTFCAMASNRPPALLVVHDRPVLPRAPPSPGSSFCLALRSPWPPARVTLSLRLGPLLAHDTRGFQYPCMSRLLRYHDHAGVLGRSNAICHLNDLPGIFGNDLPKTRRVVHWRSTQAKGEARISGRIGPQARCLQVFTIRHRGLVAVGRPMRQGVEFRHGRRGANTIPCRGSTTGPPRPSWLERSARWRVRLVADKGTGVGRDVGTASWRNCWLSTPDRSLSVVAGRRRDRVNRESCRDVAWPWRPSRLAVGHRVVGRAMNGSTTADQPRRCPLCKNWWLRCCAIRVADVAGSRCPTS